MNSGRRRSSMQTSGMGQLPSQIVGMSADFRSCRPQDPDVAADTPVDSGCGRRPEKPSNHLWALRQRDRLKSCGCAPAYRQSDPTGRVQWYDGAGGQQASSSSVVRLPERNAGTQARLGAAIAPGWPGLERKKPAEKEARWGRPLPWHRKNSVSGAHGFDRKPPKSVSRSRVR